ncbi:MAG: hypothetical protein GY696_13150 [Gammaproteobacteria bacterium]|nr:hypothetical protein [Gammaproteobacteria bacterium]
MAPQCYQEFLDKHGLGSTLSALGMARYVSRLERFHAHGFDVETPLVRPEGDVEPLAIWLTNAYCHDDYGRQVLVGMGYVPTPSVSAVKARRTKVAARRVKDKSKVKAEVPVRHKEGLGIITEPAPEKGIKRPRDAPEIDQNRGKDPSRLPCEYDVIRVTKGTIKDMMNQVAFLKVKLDDAESDRDRQRRRAERLDADYYRMRREVRAREVRSREQEKMIEKQAADHYYDRRDWQECRDEMIKEKEVLHNEVGRLQGKLAVYEDEKKVVRKARDAARKGE